MKEFLSKLFNTNEIIEPAKNLLSKILAYLPNILLAIFVIIIGWFIAKLISKIIEKLGKKLGLNKVSEKLGIENSLKKAGVKKTFSSILSSIFFWIIFLIFLLSSTDILGLDAVSDTIRSIFNYLPNILAALIIFIIGLLIANFVKKIIASSTDAIGIEHGDKIGIVVAYIIIIIISISALSQLKISTPIFIGITNIIIGILVFAFAALFIYGARNIVENILSGHYIKKNFKEGDLISCGGIEGKIVEIGPTNTSLETEEKLYMIPNSRLMKETISKNNFKNKIL